MSSDGQFLMPKGRFAPSPSGRMHLGNIFSALMSYLSVKSRGGNWLLRIEDLDPQRSRMEYAPLIEDDLHWLGLDWDEGGVDGKGDCGPYLQSRRGEWYGQTLELLEKKGLTYPCYCRRADILSTQAPHQTDGRVVYPGTCRPPGIGTTVTDPGASVISQKEHPDRNPAIRLYVPPRTITFDDMLYGLQQIELAGICGDFVVRRADGAWAYQLAVVADDAAMGVTEVVRGSDLLPSAAQQIYLFELLGLTPPRYGHVPLLCNQNGQRLSKRDTSLSMAELRLKFSPEEIIGKLAFAAGLIPCPERCHVADLIPLFCWDRLPDCERIVLNL